MKHQQEVIANVVQSNAVVITGETGCGKSTQIPHVLLAAMVQRTTTTSSASSTFSAADKVGAPLGVPLGLVGAPCGGGEDVAVPLGSGVAQGCPISPLLFLVVTEALTRAFQEDDGASLHTEWSFSDARAASPARTPCRF